MTSSLIAPLLSLRKDTLCSNTS